MKSELKILVIKFTGTNKLQFDPKVRKHRKDLKNVVYKQIVNRMLNIFSF